MGLSKLKKISKGLALISKPKFYLDIIKDLDRELEEYQRIQMLRGQTNKGDLITPKYSKFTRKEKASDPRYKAPFGTPNLLNKGEFQDGIFTRITGNKAIFGSVDDKTSELTQKYKNIFGLNSLTKSDFIKDILEPLTIDRINAVFS